jgi:hypothetical protein
MGQNVIWGRPQRLPTIRKLAFWHGCTRIPENGRVGKCPNCPYQSAKVPIWTVLAGSLSHPPKQVSAVVFLSFLGHFPPSLAKLLRCFSPQQRWVMPSNFTNTNTEPQKCPMDWFWAIGQHIRPFESVHTNFVLCPSQWCNSVRVVGMVTWKMIWEMCKVHD